MSNEELAKKILGMFNNEMSPEKRHLLIKLYSACVSNNLNNDLKDNFIQIEDSFNNIERNILKYYPDNSSKIKYVDADTMKKNEKRHLKVSMNDLKKLRKNSIKIKLRNEYDKNLKNNVEEYEFKTKILEYYIMLDDCIKNYDEENPYLKKRIIKLLTEMEILLKLPVTYPSQIPSCVDSLIKENEENEKGGVSLGK